MSDPQAQFYIGYLEGVAEGIESGGCSSDSTVPKRLREIAEWIKSKSAPAAAIHQTATDVDKLLRDFDDSFKAIDDIRSGRSSIG